MRLTLNCPCPLDGTPPRPLLLPWDVPRDFPWECPWDVPWDVRPMGRPMGIPHRRFSPLVWARLVGTLRLPWAHLGHHLGSLGHRWGALGHTLGTLWVAWASLATPWTWTPLGHPLGSLGHLGVPWAPFGLAWALPGRLLGVLGHPFRTLGTHLGGHFCYFASESPRRSKRETFWDTF